MDIDKLTDIIKEEIQKHDISAKEYSKQSSTEFSNLILNEFKRVDLNHRDLIGGIEKIRDEQIEQGKTLIRNTASLEEHIRRTNLLETKMTHVEEEVDGLKSHVDKVNFVLNLLKPTKEKLKWLLILSALTGGGMGGYELTKTETAKKIIEAIFR